MDESESEEAPEREPSVLRIDDATPLRAGYDEWDGTDPEPRISATRLPDEPVRTSA